MENNLIITFIGISIFFGVINHYKFKNSFLKYYLYFIIYVFLFAEVLSIIIGRVYKMSTFPTINTYLIINYLFHFYFFYKISKSKRIIKFFFSFYFIFTIGILLFNINYFLKDLIMPVIFIGSILLVITIILYLVEILNNDKIIFKITSFFPFWICVGNLLFFIGIFPILIMRDYLSYNGLFDVILRVLNFILYGSFSVGYILADKKLYKL